MNACRLLLLGAVLGWAGCRSSKGVVPNDAAPDAPADIAGEAPGEPLPEPPRDAAPEAPGPEAGPDVAPADATADSPAPPDAAVDHSAPDAGVEAHPGLTLSFNDCVRSNVFATQSTISTEIASIVATDFDHDGKSDVAVGTWMDDRVVTLKGKGDGTFQIVSTKTFATIPRGLCLADLNGDGTPDVVTGGPAAKSVNVMLGGAGCSIADPVAYAGTTAGGIAAGDLDKDGHLDLVVGNLDGTPSFGVYLGTGTGTLGPVSNIRSAPEPLAPVLADFDGDGTLDLVLWGTDVNTSGDYGVLVIPGLGDGTFGAATVYPTPSKIPSGNVAADFTSDGVLDLLTFYTNGFGATLMVGNGDGSFQAPRAVGQFIGGTGGWAIADFDLDGNLDVALPADTNSFAIFLGKGDGTFAPEADFYSTLGSGAIVATDFDGDGKPDLVVGEPGISTIPQLCALKNTSH
jgi:hypothetical protein